MPEIEDTLVAEEAPVEEKDIETVPSPVKTASIEFNGTLVGFVDGKDEIHGSYKYALINDGIEVLRIDLRPIVGYDVTNLEADLGVSIGNQVIVSGNMQKNDFVVVAIKSYE